MSAEELLGNGEMQKFRIITGFDKYDKKSNQYRAVLHHVHFYAKDNRVRDLLMVMARSPKGQLVLELESDFCTCFSAN